jgi:hypothetical protein
MASAAALKKWTVFCQFVFPLLRIRSHASCASAVGCKVFPRHSKAIRSLAIAHKTG